MPDTPKPREIEGLVAGQRIRAIEALAHAGLIPDPITAAALFEIGSHLLVLQGLDSTALRSRLDDIVLRTRQQITASTHSIH